MSLFKTLKSKIVCFFGTLTDWLLIICGGFLIFKAIVGIDVPVARYVVLAFGTLFCGFGFWYRYRRKQKARKLGE